MAAELKLYTNPMSRGQIARWMLEEVGQPYDTEILDYASTMKAQPYLSINPMGKVPALQHRGKVITECAAICAYLADMFPAAGLGPRDGERADYYRWLFFAAGPLEQAVTNNYLGFKPTEEQGRMVGYGSYERALDVLDSHLARDDYVCGSRFTAADVYVGSQVAWGTQFGTMAPRPSFPAYVERITARDAYKRAKEIDNGLIAQMQAKQAEPAQ